MRPKTARAILETERDRLDTNVKAKQGLFNELVRGSEEREQRLESAKVLEQQMRLMPAQRPRSAANLSSADCTAQLLGSKHPVVGLVQQLELLTSRLAQAEEATEEVLDGNLTLDFMQQRMLQSRAHKRAELEALA